MKTETASSNLPDSIWLEGRVIKKIYLFANSSETQGMDK